MIISYYLVTDDSISINTSLPSRALFLCETRTHLSSKFLYLKKFLLWCPRTVGMSNLRELKINCWIKESHHNFGRLPTVDSKLFLTLPLHLEASTTIMTSICCDFKWCSVGHKNCCHHNSNASSIPFCNAQWRSLTTFPTQSSLASLTSLSRTSLSPTFLFLLIMSSSWSSRVYPTTSPPKLSPLPIPTNMTSSPKEGFTCP